MIVTLITLLGILHFAAGGSRVTQTIKVFEGENVTLHCRLDPPVNLSQRTVEWKVDKKYVAHVYRHGWDDPGPVAAQYRGRTTSNRDDLSRGNMTLKISSANLSDSGLYKCLVTKLKDWCEVRLIVVSKDQQNRTKTDDSHTTGPADHGAVKRTAVLPVVFGVFGVAVLSILWKYKVIEICKKTFRGKKMSNNFEMENMVTGPPAGDEDPHSAAEALTGVVVHDENHSSLMNTNII